MESETPDWLWCIRQRKRLPPPAEDVEANVTIRLYDRRYELIAEEALEPLLPGSHLSSFVYELFDNRAVQQQAREMEGILVVTSDQPVVAVTLRQTDDPEKWFPKDVPILTTFPVMEGAPD